MPEKEEKTEAPPKTAAELLKEYQTIAGECARLASDFPKHKKKIDEEVKKEVHKRLGDFLKKITEKRNAKRAAYTAWEAAAAAETETK